MKIAVTGGIGSGKSYVCRLLKRRGIEVYDCDAAAKRLMRQSADLRRQLTDLIGPDTYVRSSDGQSFQLNKSAVAQFLLASESNAHAIDAIVHPAVAADYLQSGQQWMECAILFESGFDRLVDHIIVVTAPQEVRVSRIMQRDGISREKALEWMNRQWSQDEVRRCAHDEIVNDGRPLEPQIDRIINKLNITKE
jgi:dephospho-CoA kinase